MLTRGLAEMAPEERAQREALAEKMPLIQPNEVAEAVMEFVRDDSLAGEAMGIMYGRPRKIILPAIRFSSDPAQRMPG